MISWPKGTANTEQKSQQSINNLETDPTGSLVGRLPGRRKHRIRACLCPCAYTAITADWLPQTLKEKKKSLSTNSKEENSTRLKHPSAISWQSSAVQTHSTWSPVWIGPLHSQRLTYHSAAQWLKLSAYESFLPGHCWTITIRNCPSEETLKAV